MRTACGIAVCICLMSLLGCSSQPSTVALWIALGDDGRLSVGAPGGGLTTTIPEGPATIWPSFQVPFPGGVIRGDIKGGPEGSFELPIVIESQTRSQLDVKSIP